MHPRLEKHRAVWVLGPEGPGTLLLLRNWGLKTTHIYIDVYTYIYICDVYMYISIDICVYIDA